MNTKKVNNNSTPKGGKDNTQTILTSAGLMAVGAGVGTGATLAASTNNDEEVALEDAENTQETAQDKTEQQQTENQQTQSEQTDAQQTGQSHLPQGNQPQPIATDNVNGANTINSTAGNNTNTSSVTNGTPADVDSQALAVAERLVGTDDIDPNDIDSNVVVNFEQTDIIYAEDGSEIPVALVTTPDGGQFLLADVDGDHVYDGVFDMNGNPVSAVPAGINTNDAELALTDGYIAANENDPQIQDAADADIIPLDGSNDLAQAGTNENADAAREEDEMIPMEDATDDIFSNEDTASIEEETTQTDANIIAEADHVGDTDEA